MQKNTTRFRFLLQLPDGVGAIAIATAQAEPDSRWEEQHELRRELVKFGLHKGVDVWALNLRPVGPDIISCPTCGRCEIDLAGLVGKVEEALKGMRAPLKIALMGCVVNGPGEAAEADIGIAGGRGVGMLFKKGKIVKKLREDEFIPILMNEIKKMAKDDSSSLIPH